MKASGVSTVALSQSLRFSLVRAQAELVKAQKESQTGRAADAGLALGTRTAQSVSFTRDLERISGIIDSNGLTAARLAASQDAMEQLSGAAQSFLSTLTTSSSGDAIGNVTRDSARTTLSALTDILNTSFNGENIFAGINTDVKPLNDFTAPGSPAKASFDAAFIAHFGFDQNDGAAATISAADMNAFIDTQLEPLFMGAGWTNDWSNASDQRIVGRITLTETTPTSVSANDEGFRRLAMVSAMVTELFDSNVGMGARQAIIERAVPMVGDAISALGDLQARTGIIEKRVADATERLEVQSDLFERRIGNLLDIDPYEAATRVSGLLTQIETSYALTARLQQLSIIRFIS
jgi:flagellar hook-associated protein 3 FlgL